MIPIRFPRAAVRLARAAAEGDLVQIEQTSQAAVLTVAAGERVLKLSAALEAQPGIVEPFTITAGDLARAGEAVGAAAPGPAAELPLVVLKIAPHVAGITGPSGTPQTVTIVSATFPDCTGPIDMAEGERASGMTQSVADCDPRHLLDLAESAVAIGCTAVQFTFAPRFGLVLAEAAAGRVSATLVLSGDMPKQAEPEQLTEQITEADDDPLIFTMPEARPRQQARRSLGKPKRLSCEDDLPW
jgi:hypothetical protein